MEVSGRPTSQIFQGENSISGWQVGLKFEEMLAAVANRHLQRADSACKANSGTIPVVCQPIARYTKISLVCRNEIATYFLYDRESPLCKCSKRSLEELSEVESES